MPGAHRRRADDDAVEQLGIALHREHALAPAGRAAGHVAVRDRAAVEPLGQRLAGERDRAHRGLGEIERGALVGHERGVEHRALVAAVVADHREAAGEGGAVARGDGADRRPDVAVEPAAALEQEAAVPRVGQREREADRVVLAVGALVRVDRALDAAMRGQRLLRPGAPGPAAGRAAEAATCRRGGDRQARADLGAGHGARSARAGVSSCEAPGAAESVSAASGASAAAR